VSAQETRWVEPLTWHSDGERITLRAAGYAAGLRTALVSDGYETRCFVVATCALFARGWVEDVACTGDWAMSAVTFDQLCQKLDEHGYTAPSRVELVRAVLETSNF